MLMDLTRNLVFWLDDLSTYAMALDGAKRPLKVHNSDAGHLLWSGSSLRRSLPGWSPRS
jgi:glycogen debranching enzyme